MDNETCEDSRGVEQLMWDKNRELHSISLSDRVEQSFLIKFAGMNYSQP
jgi:hypothetical protein